MGSRVRIVRLSSFEVGWPGLQPNNKSYGGSVTLDRQRVAFDSEATNLVKPGENNAADVYLRDRSP